MKMQCCALEKLWIFSRRPVYEQGSRTRSDNKNRAAEVHLFLSHNEIHALAKPKAIHLRCSFGKVWITQQGNPQDYLLEAGATFNSHGNGLIVMQALGDAQIRLSFKKREKRCH